MSEITHPHPELDSGHHCCHALQALASAAYAIHAQGCCGEVQCDPDCCDCCKQSMEYVLKAIECHIACLRGMGRARYTVRKGTRTK